MATDTSEMPQTDEQTTDNETANKRERVDPATLPVDERVTISIPLPAGMKVALIKAGEAQNISAAVFARRILSERLEYSVPASFEEHTRSTLAGLTDEEKKERARKAQQERAAFAKKLMALAKSDPEVAAKLAALEA